MKKHGGKQSDHVEPVNYPVFDDALPERIASAGIVPDVQKVQLNRGPSTPSPYIVKLQRYATPEQQRDVAQEIEALAKSLIIESDEDFAVRAPNAESALAFDGEDAREQLREFDAVVPIITVAASGKPTTSPKAAAPAVSLDHALARFVDPLDLHDIFEEVKSIAPEPVIPEVPTFEVTEELTLKTITPEVETTTRAMTRWRFPVFHPSIRALGAFVCLSFVVVLPLHAMQTFAGTEQSAADISDVGKSAIEDLTRGAAALSERRYDLAKDDFSRAAEKFAAAEDSLGELHAAVVAVVSVIPETDRTYSSVRGLITAGKELSQTAEIMSEAGTGIAEREALDLVTKLELLSTYVENALPHAELAATALENVDPSVVPAEYAAKVAELKAKAPAVATAMHEFVDFIDVLSVMLGGDGKMRYLAAFQNNTELRPTGGFVGSFAEVDIEDGAIAGMRVPGGGTYEVQGQLQEFVKAPEPLSLINARWEFQDANWFPDFPTSAKKMQWFYERAGGPTTDGVIAVNANFVVDLLEIVGPIDMPEYGRTIDAENFMFEAQKIVELEYDKVENQPKAFIGDMAEPLIERLNQADLPTLLSVLSLVESGLRNKDILVTFKDNELQSTMEQVGWTGAIKQTEGDYLMVVNTNIGGGKTDGVIDQEVDVDVKVDEDGGIINTVTITKTHRGLAGVNFNGANNVDYIRLYVPEGSELISAEGFEEPDAELFAESDLPLEDDEDLNFLSTDHTVDAKTGVDVWNEFDKTVFGQWMQTFPGESEQVTFTYRLPFELYENLEDEDIVSRAKRGLGFGKGETYSLFVQKQPGVLTRTTNVHLSLPPSWTPVWSTNSSTSVETVASFDNTSDAFFGWLMTRE